MSEARTVFDRPWPPPRPAFPSYLRGQPQTEVLSDRKDVVGTEGMAAFTGRVLNQNWAGVNSKGCH